MPNIPLVISQVGATPGAPYANATGNDFGAQIGQAIQGVGEQIGQLATELGQRAKQKRTEDAANLTANFDYTKRNLDNMLAAPPGAPGFYDNTGKDFNAAVSEYVAPIKDNATREKVRASLMARRPAVMADAANHEITSSANQSKTDADIALTAVQNKVRVDPKTFDSALKDGIAVINTRPGLTADARIVMQQKFTSDLAGSRFQTLTEAAKTPDEIATIRKELNTPMWQQRMDPAQFDRVTNGLITAETQITSQRSAEVTAVVSGLETRSNDPTKRIPVDELMAAKPLIEQYGTPTQHQTFAKILATQGIFTTESALPPSAVRARKAGEYPVQTDPNAESFLLSRLAPGHPATYVTDMRPELSTRLTALFKAAPPEIAAGLIVVSGARSTAKQAQLYAASGGSGMVARPGHSQHEAGAAADIGYKGTSLSGMPSNVVSWLRDNAGKYGLKFPVAGENWHVEIVETRGGGNLRRRAGDGQNGTQAAGVPVSIERAAGAIASIESAGSGGYSAVGPVVNGGDRAYGAYGVMGANIPSWTKAALGHSMTPQEFLADTAAQDAVFKHQFGYLMEKYGNAQDAASVWFTGQPRSRGANARDVLGTSGSEYVAKFDHALGGTDTSLDAGAYTRNEARDTILANQDKMLKTDMMTYWSTVPNPPITLSTLDSPEAFKQRGADAMMMAQYGEIAKENATPLTQSEVAQFSQAIKNGPADDALSLMASMQEMGPDMARAAYKQIGATDPVFEYAASTYAHDNGATASAIMRGQERINKDPTILTGSGATPDATALQFNTTVGAAMYALDPRGVDGAKKATLAYYTETTLSRGQLYDATSYGNAVQAVLGGTPSAPAIAEVHGVPTMIPPGVTATQLEHALDNMSDGDWIRMGVQGLPPRYIDGAVAPAEDLSSEATLQAIDDQGHYLVAMADGKLLLTGRMSANGRAENYVFNADPNALSDIATRTSGQTNQYDQFGSVPNDQLGATVGDTGAMRNPTSGQTLLDLIKAGPSRTKEVDAYIAKTIAEEKARLEAATKARK